VPTTVHIPPRLLASAQRRARALGISRNRLIIQALERELREGSEWAPGFLEQLRGTDRETQDAADDLLKAILSHRRSKKPPRL
jgi:hypothetical protein